MILRNPSYRRDFLFMICLLLCCFISENLDAQGIQGRVINIFTQSPVPNAMISVAHSDSTFVYIKSDSSGHFNYQTSEARRIFVSAKASGFESYLQEEILLDGYSTYRVDLMLLPIKTLEEVTITAIHKKPLGTIRITKDVLNRVAGNFDDPVRVATGKPGILQINDQANFISVRGQNPTFNTWMLEGLEIANPNHTNNAGSFSDQPSHGGGGVNMFSAQTLDYTDLYTGITPLYVGKSTGAAINMHLHESAIPEYRAKAGLLGFEFGGGLKSGEKGVLDLNLRYSFTGLLANLGVDFGGEKIGFYDAVLSYLHLGAQHKLKLFLWGGRSENRFSLIENPEERLRYKDFFNIDYENDIAGAGIKYEKSLGQKVSVITGAAYSVNRTIHRRTGLFEDNNINQQWRIDIGLLSSNVALRFNLSDHLTTTAGLNFTHRTGYRPPFFERDISLRAYVDNTLILTKNVTLEAGIDVDHGFYQHNYIPGYRGLLVWDFTNSMSLHGGVRHSPGYILVNHDKAGSSHQIMNDKYEVGWRYQRKHLFALNLYTEEIEKLPVFIHEELFHHSADHPDSPEGFPGDNIEGAARYYGIEGEWEFQNKYGWSINANQSLSESIRNVGEGDFSRSHFDAGHATHISIAKEIIRVKNDKNRIWNFSLRGLFHGGLWEESIDEFASNDQNTTVFLNHGVYDTQLPAYKRIDAGISRTITNEKIRWRFALDIQNLLNFTNVAYSYFDPYLNRIETQKQLGIIPVFSVQASWQ